MPRWDGFARTLVFAALAAAGLPVAVTFAGVALGGESAAELYLIGVASIYAIGLCPDRSRRVAAFAASALFGAILALLPLDLRATAVGAAGTVAFTRGVLLPRSREHFALTIAIECVFAVAGLAVADAFARGGLPSLCLALWGYFLVQSGWFLFGAHALRAADPPRDPFDQARARLLRLLEDDRIV
jgi:hypothetical protein